MLKQLLYLTLILFVGAQWGYGQVQPPAGFGNNIILWLSPDSALFEGTNNSAELNDRIVEWHDISGGGYTFTNSGGSVRPRLVLYQGKRMLNFVDGDLLENTAIASAINGLTEFSVYIVIKSDDQNTDQGFLDSENPDGADDILCMRYDASGANTGRTNLIKCGMQGNSANNQIESQSNTQSNSLQCLTLTWKQGEPINLYIDGVLDESSNNGLGSAMSGIQKILLGKGPKDTGGNAGWDGRIGTVIFYNTKMSPDTVSLISGDLKSINSVQTGDWDNASTWDCNCVPPNNAFVKINDNHTVTVTKNENVNNVIVSDSGTLVLNNNRRISVRRNFTNHGTIVPNTGEIRFNGSVAQLIDGSGVTDLYDLTINNSAGVTVNDGSLNIQGTVDLVNGCLETGNRITLLSNPTGTARINTIPASGCINGDITMQRYIDAGSTDWRFITSAINGATLADLNDDFITSGFAGSDFPSWPTAANPWPSIYYYDESVPGVQDNGFVPASNISNSIANGEGLWIWCGDTSTGTQPFTIDITGAPNTGDISLPISYTSTPNSDDGWNMVGNPYPSTLDWDAIPALNKTNVNDAIYVWDPDNQQFASYVGGIGANGGSQFIASSQAFWVQATGTGAGITVTETSKSATDASFLKTSTINPLRIKVTNNHGSDEAVFNYESNATNTFDAKFDAGKMSSVNTNLPYISSIMGNDEYSINQFPEQELSIPIKVTTGVTGLHQFNIENTAEFTSISCLILEDIFTGITYDLSTTNSFMVYIYDSTSVSRFVLHIGAPFNISEEDASCYATNDGKIVYEKNSANAFDIVWKNGANNIISSKTGVMFTDSINNIGSGIYYIETTDQLCGNKIDTAIVNQPLSVISNFSTIKDTIALANAFAPINMSSGASYYLWDFGDGNTSTLFNPVHNYNTPGDYVVNLTAYYNKDCFNSVSKIITVKEEVVYLDNTPKVWINSNQLNIAFNPEIFKSFEVRNVLGQVIITDQASQHSYQVDLSSFDSSIYFVTLIKHSSQSETFKVVYSK
jgi:PKD repeat protein